MRIQQGVMWDFGADIINDVSGLTYDPDMTKTIKETGLNVVIMHSRGTPKDMDNLCQYKRYCRRSLFRTCKRVQKAVESGGTAG